MIRINKYIAKSGICSRRKADELILNASVSVNGKIVTDLGIQIDEKKDIVRVNGKEIILEEKKVYIMLNKPKGYVTTNNEQFGRKCTTQLIHEDVRVYPIGRLDMYTEGLLLFTNDGEFANSLTHPKNKVEKTYIVKVNHNVDQNKLNILRNGVDIGGYITAPAKAESIGEKEIKIVISEGKNRQVRKMCEAVGLKVLNLKRVKIGNLELGNLPVGKYRYLTDKEINSI